MRLMNILLLALLVALGALSWQMLMPSKGQEPFSHEEMDKFLTDGPAVNTIILKTAASSRASRLTLRTKTYAELEKRGWEVKRFYYIFGQCFEYSYFLIGAQETERNEATIGNLGLMETDPARYAEFQQSIEVQREAIAQLQEQVDKDVTASEKKLIMDNLIPIKAFFSSCVINFFP